MLAVARILMRLWLETSTCGHPVKLLGFLAAWWLASDRSIPRAEVKAAYFLRLRCSDGCRIAFGQVITESMCGGWDIDPTP